tara:strand:- start:332 stop:1957 length:1626 start_codon:yes stop_codon:yes gene_type:complete
LNKSVDNKRYSCEDCGSSDGVMLDDSDGHTYCFACGTYRNDDTKVYTKIKGVTSNEQPNANTNYNGQPDITDIDKYPSLGITSRNISSHVTQYFGVKTHQYDNKPAHFYPYGDDCYKVRILPKEFRMLGKAKKLFGQDKFNGGRMLVITEGELDALAVAQACLDFNKRIYPVVSIPSANQLQILLQQREWIRRFDSVIIWFDNDDAGSKAIHEASKIIGFDKVKIVSSDQKDASDLYMKHGAKEVTNVIWNAQKYNPAGILSGEVIWEKFIERQNTESIPYPSCLNGLNEKLRGMRQGEITLFTSGTGSGKSTVIKEIIWHLLRTSKDDRIGLISLEESVGDTAEKFIGMTINKRIGDVPTSQEELRTGFNLVFKDERLILLDHQGSVDDSSLIDKIEYMALMGCKYLFLDHITIAVSEGSEGLSGNEAVDKVMSDLLKIVKKHNIWLGIVSHLRKSGGGAFEEGNMASIDDIKGSGSIKQISFDIIAFSRNLVAANPADRNKIEFSVLKSRYTGLTGPAGISKYNQVTGRLEKGDGFEII